MMRLLQKCCQEQIKELMDDIGAVLGEYSMDAKIYWMFRNEWLGEKISDNMNDSFPKEEMEELLTAYKQDSRNISERGKNKLLKMLIIEHNKKSKGDL